MISDNEISVVVQGPIVKNKAGKNLTKEVCESIRNVLPKAEIILSTWEGESIIEIPCDVLITNKNIVSNKIMMPYTKELKLYSVNHQIITTFEGIKRSNRKYILKLRSDLKLINSGFISYFEKYNDYPDNSDDLSWKIFERRLVTLPTYNIHKPNGMTFNICDWFFFGKREDVLYYFDIPLVDTFSLVIHENEIYPSVEDNFGAEQIMWINCLKKTININIKNALDKSGDLPEQFEKSLALNFIPISAKKAGVLNLSYGVGAYGENPIISRGMYTLEEWELLYVKYGGGTIHIKYHLFEHIIMKLYELKNVYCENHPAFSNIYYSITKKLNKKRIK